MTVQANIFLVDDDAAVRDATSLLLKTAGYQVIAFSSAEAFIDAYQPAHPACLVSDIQMPEIDGLELQKELIDRQIDIPIIFLTGHGDIAMSVKAMKTGAVDFLEKPIDDATLLARVAEAIEQDSRQQHEMGRRADVVARYQRLTPREKEVANLVISGYSNKQIARELGISHRTVEIHRTHLMEKMQADSLPELVTLTSDACFAGQT